MPMFFSLAMVVIYQEQLFGLKFAGECLFSFLSMLSRYPLKSFKANLVVTVNRIPLSVPLAVSSYLDAPASNGAQAIFLPLFSDIAVL